MSGKIYSFVIAIGLTGVGLVASTLVYVIVTTFLLTFTGIEEPISIELSQMSGLAMAVVAELGYLLIALSYIWRTNVVIEYNLPTLRDIGVVLATTVFILVFVELSFVFISSLFELTVQNQSSISTEVLVVFTLVSLVVIAPSEELLFRGAIQNHMDKTFSSLTAVILSSLLFGTIHYANYEGDPIAIVLAVLSICVAGFALGYVYYKTKNIVVPILVHGIYNSTSLILPNIL